MDVDLLPGGAPLRADVRAVLDARHDPDALDRLLAVPPGYDGALWGELGRRGWLRFGLPGAVGGRGRLAELAVVVEEIGRSRVPTPIHSGVVQVAVAVAGAASAADAERLLAGVADGSARVGLCLPGPSGATTPGSLGVRCVAEGAGLRLSGVKRYVPFADSCDTLVIAADGPGAGVSLVAVAAGTDGVRVDPAPSIGGDRQCEIRFDDVFVGGDGVGRPGRPLDAVGRTVVVGPPGAAADAVARAVLIGRALLCAEAVGASAALIERTTVHALGRDQFGRPIAAFQAVQHRCADMVIDHLGAVGAVHEAIAALDAGGPADVEVAAAKAMCGTACLRVAASAHQIWGGTGYLADAGPHHWTRLIKGIDAQLGGAREQRRTLSRRLHDSGGWSTH